MNALKVGSKNPSIENHKLQNPQNPKMWSQIIALRHFPATAAVAQRKYFAKHYIFIIIHRFVYIECADYKNRDIQTSIDDREVESCCCDSGQLHLTLDTGRDNEECLKVSQSDCLISHRSSTYSEHGTGPTFTPRGEKAYLGILVTTYKQGEVESSQVGTEEA